MKFKYIFTLLFFVSFGFVTFGQENIEETKKIADDLFEEEKYIEATPYYLRLLAIQPRDHNFNYHYGACLLHNSGKTQDVFKYLNYAVTDPSVDAQANYFLGKAFHFNYQFNDAIKHYKIYQTKAADKAKPSFDVKRQIEMCENGKKLITTITEMIVLDKKEIEKDKFFRIYDLSDIGGNLLVTAEFQTKIDEKKAHVPLIHFPANPTVIYYSSYGENGKTGKDIYVQRRLPSGGWGLPQVLKGDVNTNFDEDYPYMHPDGQYLYFSSKGHNSMGGFDVFRCKYDPDTDMFGKAENMDFAVSSPNDDLFYVVDSLNKNAYFGSNRQSEEGKLFVYKVRVDRVPLNMSVIKGEFNSTINPQMKKVFIDVKDYSNGEFIGNFNSNEKGVYLITFPKGGKYEFTIKVGENKQEFKYLASIPFQKEFKPLKQKIIHELQGGAENVRVIDLFNEEVEDPQGVFAQVIKMKSELKPNVSAEELARMDKELKDKEILKVLGLDKLSLVEVGYLLNEKVQDAKKAEGGTKDIENKIYAQVIEHSTEIKRLDGLIKDKIEKANSAPNDKRKYKYLKEAERSLKIQEELKALNDKSMHLADSLSKNSTKGSSEVTAEITKFSEHFNELIKENKQAEAYAYLADNKDDIKRIVETENLDPLQELIERGLLLDAQIAKLQPKDEQYDRDLRKIDAEIAELERTKEGAKKKQIEEIDAVIKAKANERSMIAEERNFNGQGLNDKIAERSDIRKQVDVLEAIYVVQTPKVITKEELDAALQSSNSTNSSEVRSKISEQIAQLVLTSPDVKVVDYEDLEKDLGPVVSNSRGKSDRIKADATLSPQEKANRLKALDRELLSSINTELINAEKALKSNPTDPELVKKLEALQSAKTLVSSSLDLPEGDDGSTLVAEESSNENNANQGSTNSNQTTAAASNTTNPGPLDSKGKENLIESVNSSYNETLASINSNKNLTESEKLVKLQEADKSLISSLDKEISSAENALKLNSTDPLLLKKLDNLKTVRVEVEAKITSRENEIVTLDIPSKSSANSTTTNVNTPLDSKGRENLIESVNSSYNETLASINSNQNLTESQKLVELQEVDKSLISSLDKEISSVENALKLNSTDPLLLKKLDNLKTVREEVEAKISSRENQIASLESPSKSSSNSTTINFNTSLDSKGKENLIESVNSSYNETLASINSNQNLTESEKLSQLQVADKTLVSALNKEIIAVEEGLKSNPTDALLVNKLENLKSVRVEVEAKIVKRENQLTSLAVTNISNPVDSKPTTTSNSTLADKQVKSNQVEPTKVLDTKSKESLIESVNSSYNEKIAEINSNTSLSTTEKLVQLQQLDKSLLNSIDEVSTSISTSLKQNPANVSLAKKVADLSIIKSEIQEKVKNRDTQISNVTTSNDILDSKGKETIIESINSTYNEQVEELQSNSSLSENEKLTQLQQLDEKLVLSINKQITINENSLKLNTTDEVAKKKISELKSIRSDLEIEMGKRESKLTSDSKLVTSNSPLDSKGKENLIESVNSSYNEKVNQINGNQNLTESEKLNQLQLVDKELISSVNKELVNISGLLKQNPIDANLIKKETDLKSVRTDLETIISSRENALLVSSQPLSEKAKSDIIDELSPMHNVKVADIKSNSKLTELEKTDQLQKADKELVSLINKEILALENNIKNNPDPQLIRDLSDLKKVKKELESHIVSREANSTPTSNAVALTSKEKESIIESINPNYNENVNSINSNSSISTSQKLDELSKLDKELLNAVNTELNNIEASLKMDVKNADLLKKEVDFKILKKEIETKFSLSNLTSTSPELSVSKEEAVLTESEKSDLIESVNSTYNEKVSEVNANSSLTSIEKATKIQVLDKDLFTSISKEISKTETALRNDPSNEQLIKKEADLNELKSEIDSKIAQQNSVLAVNKQPVDEKVKSDILKSINTKYDKTVTSINTNTDLSVSEKLNKLQELDYSIVEGLNKDIKITEEALIKKPNDKALLVQLDNLNAVKSEIEASISSRESVIASSGSTIDVKIKSELIESISTTYNEKASEIKENEYLLDGEKMIQLQELDKGLLTKVQSEIKSLEKSLSDNPTNSVDKRKLEGFKAVELDLAKSIAVRDKSMSPSDLDHALAKKGSVIEKFSPEYNEKVEEINSHALNSQVQKLEELQKLDEELLVQIKEEVNSSTAAAKKKSKDQDLLKAKTEIIELQSLAENVISERAKEIEILKANSVTSKQKEELISGVKPDYSSKIDNIKDAKYDHSKELQELIKEEENLVSLLINNELKVKAELAKNPSDEVLKTKLNVAIATKLESQSKLEDLEKQAITLEAHDIDQSALIVKVDPSFETDIFKIETSNSSNKSSELVAREVKLQEKIQAQITENEKVLTEYFNLEKAAENQILVQKLKESNDREESYKNGKTPILASNLDPKALTLRNEILGKSADEINKEYTDVDDLKSQENIVSSYLDVLKVKSEKNTAELVDNAQDQGLKDQKLILDSELKNTELMLKKIAMKIDVLENSTEDTALSSPELKVLIDKENLLKEQLVNPLLTKKEKSVLEKELKKVQTDKSIESNKLISKNITVRKADNEAKTVQLQKLAANSEISKVNADLADSQNERLTKEADALIAKSDKTKNPIAKNELLTQAIDKQTQADEIVVAALEENITKAAIQDKVTTLDSEEELEEKKRNYAFEIEEIDKQVGEIETQIAVLKPKKAVALVEKKDALVTEKSLVEKQLEEIERQLTEIAEAPKSAKTVSEKALDQPVTFGEEKQLIASKDYLEYSINANKALRIEKQIAETEIVLTQKRQTAKETISMSLDKTSNVSQADVAQSIDNVKIVEEELKKMAAELEEKQKISNDVLVKNSATALQMQNLVKRGVEPEFNENLALIEQQRTPAVGLKVVDESTPINTYSESNPIPVNVKNPSGLLYRIQVGAFSKPIPQDMYKSFNPVSGEKLASGVTRYMAGYFNNSKTVDEAFSQVKALGYTDAFIVAYCDDERIPLADARKLELSGQCISTDSREFVIAMAKTPVSKEANTNDLSYNDAPGAVKAIPAEAHLGLFYTVQVGVYNKPATPHQLKNIDPIVSKRLPNGQIRYSSGMFSSVDAAKPKKEEARGKGVKDAFVTAYYKGERLTLSQASQLLKQKGEGILEKIDTELLASVSNKETVKAEVVKTTPKVTSTKEEVSAYNKAPGAVPAKAVEAHLGLFFTVQIGVYSKPANSKQLNFVTPLITKKLPNGQLRYSSGMYSSIEAAEPKRKEILEKGVKHAYITAYYKGERITIAEAKELLSTNGESILEKLDK